MNPAPEMEPIYTLLPHVNALLNAGAFGLLLGGWMAIKKGQREKHIGLMMAALVVSAAFLVTYLIYHAKVGSVPFKGEGLIRPVYFTILITHIIGAAVIIPMVLRTTYLATKERWELHRKWGRITLPLWIYVSVTGVLVYFFVHRLYQ